MKHRAEINICKCEELSYICGMWYNYTLTNPLDNSVFYVGSTNNIRSRYRIHISDNNNQRFVNPQYNSVMNELEAFGTIPILMVIERHELKCISHERELYWVEYYKLNNQPLCNIKLLKGNIKKYKARNNTKEKSYIGEKLHKLIQSLFRHGDAVFLSHKDEYSPNQILSAKRTGIFTPELLTKTIKYLNISYDEVRQEYIHSQP